MCFFKLFETVKILGDKKLFFKEKRLPFFKAALKFKMRVTYSVIRKCIGYPAVTASIDYNSDKLSTI